MTDKEKKALELHDRKDEIDPEADPVLFGTLMSRLKDKCRESGLVAIPGPLAGVDARMFCMRFAGGDIRGFANPMVVGKGGSAIVEETQLGMDDGRTWFVPRPTEVDLVYQTPLGKAETCTFEGISAAVVQQMVDFLDGILLEDFALEKLDGWDSLSDEDKEKIFELYRQSLETRYHIACANVSADPEAKMLDGQVEFIKNYYEDKIDTIPLTAEESRELESAVKAEAAEQARKSIDEAKKATSMESHGGQKPNEA